jgi:hypothetical protein
MKRLTWITVHLGLAVLNCRVEADLSKIVFLPLLFIAVKVSVRSQRYRFQGTSQPIRTKPDFLGTTNVPNESLGTVVMVGTLP